MASNHGDLGWGIAITTAPRDLVFLGETIRSIQSAGWDDQPIHVFAEPGSRSYPTCKFHQNNSKLGAWRNWRHSLSAIRRLEPKANRYMLCQDDIIFRQGLRRYLENHVTCYENAVFSPYTSRKDAKTLGDKRDWIPCGSGWALCGACCFVMNQEMAQILDTELPVRVNKNMHIDGQLARFLQRKKYALYVHKPSLVQHLADEHSTLGYQKNPFLRTGQGFTDDPIQPT